MANRLAMFRRRFYISLLLSVPTLVWGRLLQWGLGYNPPQLPGAHWIPAVCGTCVCFYGGAPFLQDALHEIRARSCGMMTLLGSAICVGFGFSLAATLGRPGFPLWEGLATLVTTMLLGHWIQVRSVAQARLSLAELGGAR